LPSVSDLINKRSQQAYHDIEKGLPGKKSALMAEKPDVDHTVALVNDMMEKYNAVVTDVTKEAGSRQQPNRRQGCTWHANPIQRYFSSCKNQLRFVIACLRKLGRRFYPKTERPEPERLTNIQKLPIVFVGRGLSRIQVAGGS